MLVPFISCLLNVSLTGIKGKIPKAKKQQEAAITG